MYIHCIPIISDAHVTMLVVRNCRAWK